MWRVRLFDGPVLERVGGEATVRFRSTKVQGLLAYLALRLGRRCPREAIADALWPDEPDATVTANRLRVTLASLRRQLEPPGTPFGSVLDASVSGMVSLREETVWCDAAEFERAYAAGRRDEAARLLRGPLLPGIYEEWVRPEQLRFEALHDEFGGVASVAEATPSPPVLDLAPTHRLPPYLTRFVGRDAELDALRRHLQEGRLVTLTGPGGIGKTRLAVEAAARSLQRATFVALESLDEPNRLAEAVLAALGVASRDGDPDERLVERLRERTATLLILDGAERLVEPLAEWLPRLLAAVPDLRALVTSRQRLEVPGELTLPLNPLATPAEGGGTEALASSPAGDLFLDRARTAVPDFVLRERHVDSVVAICRRLEGMPLALELAAARVAVQPLAGIAEGLETNAMGLRSRQRGLSERHRSLRAAIEGSVEVLSPDSRRLFARLSTFRNGWTAAAAAEVAEEPQAEEILEELLVRSLVTVRTDDSTRYAFLAPIQAYAAELLLAEEADALRLRHADYFLRLAAAASEDDLRTMRPLDAEGENLRRALETGRVSAPFWMGLAGALIHAFVRGHHRQAVRWIEATIPDLPAVPDPQVRFRWRYAAAQILPDVGRLDATDAIARAMRADAEASGDIRGAIYADVILAYVVELKGGIEAAIALAEAALARARLAGNRHLLETSLSHLSGSLHVYGAVVGREGEAGRAALARSEALAREMRTLVPAHSRRLALGPLLLGGSLWAQGRLAEAVDSYKEAQLAAVRLGTTTELMYAFVSEAAIVVEWGDDTYAAELYGAFRSLQERMGYSLERAQSSRPPWIERLAKGLYERLGAVAFEAHVAEGGRTAPAVLAARRVDSP